MRIDPAARAYVARRRAQGRIIKEIMRSLKRYITRQLYRTSNSQDLRIGVSGDLLIASGFFGLFDEFAVREGRAGADEGDQVWCVDGAPSGLGGLDEFERHRHPGRA